MSAPGADRIAVGRIGRAHGVRGDVQVQVLTDAPDRRFAVGVVLHVGSDGSSAPASSTVPAGSTTPTRSSAPADAPPALPAELRVRAVRWQNGRLLVGFDGVEGRAAAEALRGRFLEIEPSEAGPAGQDAWWDHELVGLSAQLQDGREVGTVSEVVHLGGQDLLVVARPGGAPEVLVPFVAAVVPVVEPAAGRVVLTPPEGLLEL